MAKEIKVQETIQSDFSVVVNDIAEELLPSQKAWDSQVQAFVLGAH